MFNNYQDLVKALKDGANPEDILHEFADLVNDAIDEAAAPTKYECAIEDLSKAWNNTIIEYCDLNDIPAHESYYMDSDSMRKYFETAIKTTQSVNKITDSIKSGKNDFDEVIGNFLKTIMS